jgi:phospholipase C
VNQKIQHLLVLMLENRSFDHMLGYLEYPPEAGFEGVRGREKTMPNPLPDGKVAIPGDQAPFALSVGPGHSHNDVLQQLLGTTDRSRPFRVTNNGFAANYDAKYSPGNGGLALQCFSPERVPVLSALAQQFAVCDHWFCSVPGATWPNRNFIHSGTSDGQVNIVTRFYQNPTIFERLSAGQRDWAIYYGGFPPQSFAFSRLWSPSKLHWLQRFKPIEQLYRAIRFDRLPHYAWIEPDMLGKLSDSQHPGVGGEMDFRAGEHLIWSIYNALRENPDVFEKTVLLITYDEHGGFFDHVPPPQDDKYAVDEIYEEPATGYCFPFDLLGLRVPAILVSPWIDPLTIDSTVYDHTSVPATIGKVFDVDVSPLGKRVQVTNTFEQTLRRDSPRAELPELPEPVVDDTIRTLVKEPDLRPSLMAIARDMIWQELAARPAGQPQLEAFETGPEPAPGLAISAEEAERVVMQEIAPDLSPEAQQALAEESAHELLPGLQTAVDKLKQFAGHLGSLELIDDLGVFGDRVLRRFFDSHKVILRTAAGASLEQPDPAALASALDELPAAGHGDPSARIWLADFRDRWLTVYGDGRATFQDESSDQELTLRSVSRPRALELLGLLKAGEIRRLRRAFAHRLPSPSEGEG